MGLVGGDEMKFNLTTSGCFYKDKDKIKLGQLGFRFKTTEEVYGEFTHKEWYKDEDFENPVTIEINTLEELIQFVKEWGEIIISEDGIKIYDDYIE